MGIDMFGALTVADVPRIDDDGEAFHAAARRLATALTWVAEEASAANSTWLGLPDVLAGPRLTPALEPLMKPVLKRSNQLREAGEQFLRTATRFADEIAELKKTRNALVEDIEAFHASAAGKALTHAQQQAKSEGVLGSVAALVTVWNQVPELVGEEIALRVRLQAYEAVRSSAIDTAARQINTIDIPAVDLPKVGDSSDAAALLDDGMAPAAVAALAGVSVAALLKELSGRQLTKAFANNQALRAWLKGRSVMAVSSWWRGLSAGQKNGVIDGAPRVVGALAGVPYTDRSTANVALLQRTMAVLKKAGQADGSEYKALKAVDNALGVGAGKGVGYQLVSLALGADPLAAISVGDLDTAQNVTYMVPGMDTTVENNMKGYVVAAGNLHTQQDAIAGGNSSSADIAWLGYHAPHGVAEEASSAAAIAGANLLASDIDAFDATRAAVDGAPVNVSIVAHSYGTITAAAALQTARVDHAVFEGSPGVPRTIAQNASDLKVPNGQVFATQSSWDGLAAGGQLLNMADRTDPTASSFGAHDFSSDGTNGMRAVTNHGPADGNSTTRASYWDARTESIYNVAQATLGNGSSIQVGGTPLDRLANQIAEVSPRPLGL